MQSNYRKIQVTTGILSNMRPELVGRLNVDPSTGFRFYFRLSYCLSHFRERCFRFLKIKEIGEELHASGRGRKDRELGFGKTEAIVAEGRDYKAISKISSLRCSGYLEYWEHRPTPVQILSGQVQSLRYNQPGHLEMLHSIPITGVSRKKRANSHDGFEEPIGSNFENPIRVTTGIFSNMGPELVRRLNVVPITGFDSVSGCPVLCAVSGNVKSFIFQQSKTDRLLDYRRISILPSTARRPTRSQAGKHDFWEEFLVGILLKDKQQQSNDRKEALATKALQAVVNKIDQFDGRNISRYLRCYVHEMELNRVSEKKMVALFGLATISEIRDHITSITDRYENSWELLREFERQYSQLSKVEKLTLEPNKVDLFLQAADGELQGKLEILLEDKEEDEGLTTKWKNMKMRWGFLGGVSGGDSSKGQGMHMDPSIASLFQAFSLSMQQQQSNDRKEALATKALQAVVNKIDQFDGRNISRYLRCYVHEMELNRVSEKKMVALFGLATISEIRDHITSITDRYENSWELLREFERQYSQLSKVEKLTLEPNKVDLFLQAADGELQGKLEILLEDKEEDEGLTTKWKNIEDAVGLLTKRERRKDRSNIQKTVQAPKAPVHTRLPTMPTVQPSTSLSKKADMGMKEIIREM
uniref:Predicted protein n=1 Tax=Physcomitrium patens TaxID=3218 RepID=A9U572_PHYPA